MTEDRPRRAARALQFGFLALLIICVAQLGYWLVDEYRYTTTVRQHAVAEYEVDARWATELMRAGIPWDRIVAAHPELELAPDGAVIVSAGTRARLDADRFHRLNRYSWEGAFFLVVLLGAMSVVYSALREETALRRRQRLFLAATTHELRSPLASLRLSADTLALRDPAPARRTELVARMLADLGRLERTIANILDASRLSSDRVTLAREPVALGRTVDAVVDELQPLAAEAGVRLEVDVLPTLTLLADREGVHTVVRNLVHNAIKASRGTAPADAAVSLAGRFDDGHVRLDVRDQGIGFEPSDGTRLFEMFYRSQSPGQERLAGTGLGLYLVRRCMELESGAVLAASDGPGRGACFTVRWPTPAPGED